MGKERVRWVMRDVWRLGVRHGPLAAILVLTALVGVLTAQKRDLRIEARSLRRQVDFPQVGTVFPPFDGVTLGGDTVRIGAPPEGERQVLFIFDTRCGNCRISLPTWKTIAAELEVMPDSAGTEVYGISLDPPADTNPYVEEHGLLFPVVEFPNERYRDLWKVRGVPLTVVVGPPSVVEYVFVGSIFGDAERTVFNSVVSATRR